MSETESSSKRGRMVYDSGRDRLSELPPSIIDTILSLVSIRDAVRTSILSKQFRYTWTSLPHLVFDKSKFRSKECMNKFVTNVLKLHKGPILKLTVLDVFYCHQPFSIVYSFDKLTHLELHLCELGLPPLNFTGFLFLRCLILLGVTISLNDVESIVANSPLLETLKIHGGGSFVKYPELRISSPKLKYFDLQTVAGFTQIYLCAPILAEMCVSTFCFENGYRSTYNYTSFFGGCTSLQILKGNYFTRVMSHGIDSCQYSFVLPHLKVIELDDVIFGDVKQISIIARLVTGAPNLQELKLTRDDDSSSEEDTSDSDTEAPDVSYIDYFTKLMSYSFGLPHVKVIELNSVKFGDVKHLSIIVRLVTGAPNLQELKLMCDASPEEDASDSDSEAPDVSYIDCFSALSFKCEKLKIIRMSELTSLPSKIQFLKLLLENSPALERMHLTTHVLAFQEAENLKAELLKCNLASPNFKLCIW